MFFPWVTHSFSLSNPNFFKIIFHWKISFPVFFSSKLTKGYIKECTHLFLQQNSNLETVLFFGVSFGTVFNFALLCELQNRPWKTNFIVVFFVIISEHLVKCFFSWLNPWPIIMFFFCFDLFVQFILFYIKKLFL